MPPLEQDTQKRSTSDEVNSSLSEQTEHEKLESINRKEELGSFLQNID